MERTVFDNIDPDMLKRIRAMRLFDDEFMSLVFNGDIEATQLLIRILLNRNDLVVTKSITQIQKTNLFGKSVKLDVVAEDIFKTEYNIEIQRAGSGAGARRIRYHQAMLDSHTLNKGGKFTDFPNLFIIFILEQDYFGKGNPVYRVIKTLDIKDEYGNYLLFDDDCNIMYVNGEYRGDNPLGKLMHDFSTTNADEMYFKELADKMRFFKQDEEGVQMASRIIEEYGDERAAEALKQGIQQGLQQKAEENAIKMLQDNLSTDKTAQYSGLPLEKILELQKTIDKKA